MYDINIYGSGQQPMSGGKSPDRAGQAAQARAEFDGPGAGKKSGKGKHGKHKDKAKDKGQDGTQQLTQAAGMLLQAAQQLSSLGLQNSLGAPGGYGPPQALALGQSLGNGFSQFAGAAPTVNFNFNFGANPFASSFASSFGAPQTELPQPSFQAFAFAFSA